MLTRGTTDVEWMEEAAATLQRSQYKEIRNVAIDVDESGRLRLRGVVSTFYLKQLAQELVRGVAVSQGFRIDNQVEVALESGFGSSMDGF
jgi:hypothetical protein